MPVRLSSGKAAFSRSPLAHKLTHSPIHKLTAELQEYLHFPDPGPLYATCGALVGSMMRGYPVWLMLIGPPSCGKSQLLNALLSVPRIRPIDNVSGEAAFLSGTRAKERAKDATGGLLREIGDRGALVCSDFTTTVLSQDVKKIREIMGVLRLLYDGRWTRDMGTDGGKTAAWSGRIGFLCGSTDAIDHQPAVGAEMGERCLTYRYPSTDDWSASNRAAANPDPELTAKGIENALLAFLLELDLPLDWSDAEPPRALSRSETSRIICLAQFTARARAVVHRDWRTREIIALGRPEQATRLVQEFAQLYRGMERSGCTAAERWGVLVKMACDTMLEQRRQTVAAVSGHGNVHDIERLLAVSHSQAYRLAGDANAQQLAWAPDARAWRLTDWVTERLEAV